MNTGMTPKHRLDIWWATEPFGFDHPDTYEGILKLISEAIKDESNLPDESCKLIATERDQLKAENETLKGTLHNRTNILNKYRERVEALAAEKIRKRVAKSSPTCKNGHLKTPETYYRGTHGRGVCRVCSKDAMKRYKTKKENLGESNK